MATHSPGQAGSEPDSPIRSLVTRAEFAAIGLLFVVGIVAWGIGIFTRAYDYDEVTRAHSVWLVSQGLRTYGEVFECHPPYFVLLTPLARRWTDPVQYLTALRLFSALGNMLFLGGLLAISMSSIGRHRRWAVLGLGVVAFHPIVVDYLVEFRIDGWGYALGTWSIVRFLRLSAGPYRAFELGLLSGIATLLFCPKLAFLPPLLAVMDQLVRRTSIRTCLRDATAYLAGSGIAACLIMLFAIWQGIDLARMYQLLFRYHAIGNANASRHFGLLKILWQLRAFSSIILAGVIGWGWHCIRSKTRPEPYPVALLVWLVVFPLIVAYPYKQYYAPWFLFASFYLCYLGPSIVGLSRSVGVIAVIGACLFVGFSSLQMALIWTQLNEASYQKFMIRWMNRVALPDDRVVTSPPLNPIDRRDTFFVWFYTDDEGGFDSERIMERLPLYRDRVTRAYYRSELEAHPPALIYVAGYGRCGHHPPGQMSVLNDFIMEKGYLITKVRGTTFALRPDRWERARREGLIE